MLLIGLTGGIGMGKSVVADHLLGRGENVIDTDVVARNCVAAGQPALQEIKTEFGPGVFRDGDTLDRKSLAALVFADATMRVKLERILHPRIRATWKAQVEQWRAEEKTRAIVVIPLLYETGAEREFDRVLCVACSPSAQRARLSARGWTDLEIERRNAAQWPVSKKMDLADGVIWNEATPAICYEQCARLLVRE